MISPITGEVAFTDGLRFSPHEPLSEAHIKDARTHVQIQIPGWTSHVLGAHSSSYGVFDVEAVSDEESRIQAVLVSHIHSFYESGTANDSERRAFHESIIARELHGQQEFSWGTVFCRLLAQHNRDWLVVVYNIGPHVPLHRAELLRHLREHEPVPSGGVA